MFYSSFLPHVPLLMPPTCSTPPSLPHVPQLMPHTSATAHFSHVFYISSLPHVPQLILLVLIALIDYVGSNNYGSLYHTAFPIWCYCKLYSSKKKISSYCYLFVKLHHLEFQPDHLMQYNFQVVRIAKVQRKSPAAQLNRWLGKNLANLGQIWGVNA